MRTIVDLASINLADISRVGGKNAATGEMIQHLTRLGIQVPQGFATTAQAYREFIAQQKLDHKIAKLILSYNKNDLKSLQQVSTKIRRMIIATPFLPEFERDVRKAYTKLGRGAVAVRSSATAEDLPTASFAGAQETLLNISGYENVLISIKQVYASLFTARAIAYRRDQGFNPLDVALSVGIQPMVRSDKGVSGVMFTLDTESGFDQVVMISAAYGLGETIVQGQVNPDEFTVYKPTLAKAKSAILQRQLGSKEIKMVYTKSNAANKSTQIVGVPLKDRLRFCLTDAEVHTLAQQAVLIEKHYGVPMDIEWAKDGINGQLYIVQARPETVNRDTQQQQAIELYVLQKKGPVLVTGQSVGQRIGAGVARVILNPKEMAALKPGDVLVTDMTDPDWEPIMKIASAIVTNRGGRTCHAAIIARELGIPAVVGCGNATTAIKNMQQVTVSCEQGQAGYVYAGRLPFQVQRVQVNEMPKLPVNICMNLGNPEKAFTNRFLPNAGVGLARLEFIISDMIGIHPNAALNFSKLTKQLQASIRAKTTAYKNPVEYYIERLREGIAMIAAAFDPKEVIFRFSDFKSNEYANLLGGQQFEPNEENPMIGFRGASRYKSKNFAKCFALECIAFKRVRDEMGLTNAQVMIPFVRTVAELKEVIAVIEQSGLKRGKNKLKIYMMCEIPSNVILAKEFLKYVDGFSVGSNDLTQLTLGLDRDSNLVASLFDERNEAIKILLRLAIAECNRQGKYIGICGQAPSDYPDFAKWLMQEGIQSMSLNPDTIISTWLMLAKK